MLTPLKRLIRPALDRHGVRPQVDAVHVLTACQEAIREQAGATIANYVHSGTYRNGVVMLNVREQAARAALLPYLPGVLTVLRRTFPSLTIERIVTRVTHNDPSLKE